MAVDKACAVTVHALPGHPPRVQTAGNRAAVSFANVVPFALPSRASRATSRLWAKRRRLQPSPDWKWACHEKVVQCPEGPVFTADRSGTKIPPGRPSGLAVQRETVIVSQNDAQNRNRFAESSFAESKNHFFEESFCETITVSLLTASPEGRPGGILVPLRSAVKTGPSGHWTTFS